MRNNKNCAHFHASLDEMWYGAKGSWFVEAQEKSVSHGKYSRERTWVMLYRISVTLAFLMPWNRFLSNLVR